MYTQGLDSLGKDCLREEAQDGAGVETRFQRRVDAEDKIEPKDWMPEAYRRTLIRQISQHAHSEIVGMLPEGNWITRAPSPAAQDDPDREGAGRGRARRLSVQRGRDARRLARRNWSTSCSTGKAKYSSIFNYPTLTWADVGAIGWLVDGAAIMNQIPLCRCSYGPYARAMVRICKEESFHQRQGYEIMMRLAARHASASARWHRTALDRWWWPSLMMFGPSDAESKHSAQSMRWKIKRFSNDELRQKFVDTTVPQADFLGLKVPDPALRWDEATRALPLRRDRLARVRAGAHGQRPLQPRAPAKRAGARMRRAAGCARPRAPRRRSSGANRRRRPEGGRHGRSEQTMDWPLYEIFIRARSGLDHKHVGSLHATDARMAIEHARDLYTRRQEGVSIWVGAARATSSRRIRARRMRCSSRPATRSIATRRSTTSRTR